MLVDTTCLLDDDLHSIATPKDSLLHLQPSSGEPVLVFVSLTRVGYALGCHFSQGYALQTSTSACSTAPSALWMAAAPFTTPRREQRLCVFAIAS